jgi:putative flippase GtrA
VDVLVFTALRTTLLTPEEFHGAPLVAKIISTTLAIACNWVGNRLWTYRDRRRSDVLREGIEYAAVSVAGLLIALGCLWISHYVLGHTSVLADNVATNGVGLLLGTAFRFALYRWWIYGVGTRRKILSVRPEARS